MRLDDLDDRLNARLSALNKSIDDRINRLNERISTFGEFAVNQKKTITVEILCDTNEKYTIHIWAIDECDKVEIGILNDFYMAYSKYYRGNQDDVFKIFKNARSELKTPIGGVNVKFGNEESTFWFPSEDIAPSEVPAFVDNSIKAKVKLACLQILGYYEHVLMLDLSSVWGTKELDLYWAWARFDIACKRYVKYNNAACFRLNNGKNFYAFGDDHRDFLTVCHEITHGVSGSLVKWKAYRDENGAINESFSDIFAIFAKRACGDLRGITADERWNFCDIRNLAHPSKPNRKTGWTPAEWYKEPQTENSGWYEGDDDNGGVHRNNGVICRLCFLLCEGEKFTRSDGRSFDVRPIGFEKTEKLFYGLLKSSPRYLLQATTIYNVYKGIKKLAEDLKFTHDDKNKIEVACDAVNIIPQDGVKGAITMEKTLSGLRRGVYSSDDEVAQAVCHAFLGNLLVKDDRVSLRTVETYQYPDEFTKSIRKKQYVFEQLYRGIPVFGSSLIVFLDSNNLASEFCKKTMQAFPRSFNDVIGKNGAVASISRHIGHDVDVAEARLLVYDPFIFNKSGEQRLTWHIITETRGLLLDQYLVDAENGMILLEAPMSIS